MNDLAPDARRNERPGDAGDNRALIERIRYVGQILGDVIREQEGAETFALIENIRRLCVAFSHDGGGEALGAVLKGLSGEQMVVVVRAFTYLCHLINICEDSEATRRLAGNGTREGSLAHAARRLAAVGIDGGRMAQALADGVVSPVLTAHPTEVQRKSVLEAERAIGDILGANGDGRPGARDAALLRGRVTQLWQTRMLRQTGLTVQDEIENGLSYYPTTFLPEIPRLYEELEEFLGCRPPPFLRLGSWIGGDRDGNPNVTAQTLEAAVHRQCEVALTHYLDELHALGAELSISEFLVGCTPELAALADRSGDENPHRGDEPYRRAVVGIYSRLASTLKELTGASVQRHAVTRLPAYGDAAELLTDLAVIERSLRAHHGADLVGLKLGPLIRAIEVFGFHLTLSLIHI